MGILDGLMSQFGGNIDVANMAAKIGLSPEQVEQAMAALGAAHTQPGDTVEAAAASTGLSADTLQQIVGHIGGEGSLGRFAEMLGGAGGAGGMLGNLGEMASGFLGDKKA